MEWLQNHIFPAEASLTPERVRDAARFSCLELVRHGCTAFYDMYMIEDAVGDAVEDVWLADVSTNGSFRVTRHFFDALGRETNTVVHAGTTPGEAVVATAPPPSRILSTVSTSYPLPGSDCVVRIDERGAITNVVDGLSFDDLRYGLDALGRPVSRNADAFSYNARGEIASASIAGHFETHEYDAIGNAVLSVFGSETNAYAANCLNQYTAITGGAPLLDEPPVGNTSAPSITLSYDPDGNMTQCGDWTYSYDSGGRLRSVASNGVSVAAYAYDATGRRVCKTTNSAMHTFFYDGWNLVGEIVVRTDGTVSTNRYYWGKDISGSLQEAGGVGGLLAVSIDDALYIPCYDNIGNVTRYLDASGNTVAAYTYGVFGNLISKAGLLADFFRHRFSTKIYEIESGLLYYDYRFYSPSIMRWLNRDQIEEDGGANL